MSYLWRVPHQLDDSALRARIGTLAATPLQDALAATLRDLFPQGSGPVSAPPSSAESTATPAHLIPFRDLQGNVVVPTNAGTQRLS
jgi:hypothetical protein